MTIMTKKDGSAVTLAIEGRVDTVTAPDLQNTVTGLLPEADKIIMDFEKLDYISSAGLRALLFTQKQMTEKNGSFVLTNVSDDIMSVFDITGFKQFLTIE